MLYLIDLKRHSKVVFCGQADSQSQECAGKAAYPNWSILMFKMKRDEYKLSLRGEKKKNLFNLVGGSW